MMGATDPEGSRVQPQSNTEPLEAYCRVAGASLLESLGNYWKDLQKQWQKQRFQE